MLQSEFFDRTKVNLTPEEYVKIETLYNEVEMNKDEFCKQWLKLRSNPLMKEVIEAFYTSQKMRLEIARLKEQLKEKDKFHIEQTDDLLKEQRKKLYTFAGVIVRANESGDARVYDAIEEEFGIAFIIKTKHDAGIPLSEEEIQYMVNKL